MNRLDRLNDPFSSSSYRSQRLREIFVWQTEVYP